MRLHRLFYVLRRFNALLPVLALLTIVLGVAWDVWSTHRANTPPKTVVPPSEEQVAPPTESLKLRWLDLDMGPSYSVMRVVKRNNARSGYEGIEEIRNLIVVGTETGTVKWVFPSQSQRLITIHPLQHGAVKTLGLYVEGTETPGTGKSEEPNMISVYLIKADGSSHQKVLSGVHTVMNKHNDANSLRLIYQKDNAVRWALIDLKDFSVRVDRQLAALRDFKN